MNDLELRWRADARLQHPTVMAGEEQMAAMSPPQDARLSLTGLHPLIDANLAVSEERMRQAINATDLAIWDYDLESGRVHLSDSWSWLLGGERKPTDTTIVRYADLIPEPDRSIAREAAIRAVKNEGSPDYRVLHRVIKADGSFLWVRSEGKVVKRAPDGRALRMIGVNRDITERKIMHDQLIMREARYRAVIETAVDGFWTVDMAGHLLEVNDAYVRQSGYSRDELLQMRISDLEARERPREVAAHQEKIRQTGHDRFETEHRRKDGSVWPVEVEAAFWPALDLSFVFVEDCTERKRIELQMADDRKKLAALQRSQIAAQTAAAFAHELNQPLGAISSYTEAALMMLNAPAPNVKRLRETLQKARDQALRAGNSIRELLALLGTEMEAAETLDLNREIRHLLNLARSDNALEFRSELCLEQDLRPVRASRVHLQKVMLTLVCNAVDAMREARVPEPAIIVSVRTRADGCLAEVTVRDHGPGVTREALARLFEPFYTTKQKGFGMGLAIGRSLIEANGGQLWCAPSDGPGAVFHLTLPFAD